MQQSFTKFTEEAGQLSPKCLGDRDACMGWLLCSGIWPANLNWLAAFGLIFSPGQEPDRGICHSFLPDQLLVMAVSNWAESHLHASERSNVWTPVDDMKRHEILLKRHEFNALKRNMRNIEEPSVCKHHSWTLDVDQGWTLMNQWPRVQFAAKSLFCGPLIEIDWVAVCEKMSQAVVSKAKVLASAPNAAARWVFLGIRCTGSHILNQFSAYVGLDTDKCVHMNIMDWVSLHWENHQQFLGIVGG